MSSNSVRPIINNFKGFQTSYSPKVSASLTFAEDSPYTKQSFKDECDINILMSRYLSTGELPVLNQAAPQYLDVTGHDYQEAMQFVAGAKTLFNELPASLRNRFDNDPALFLDFCSDSRNRVEMAQMGLLKEEVATKILNPEPVVSPVVEVQNES